MRDFSNFDIPGGTQEGPLDEAPARPILLALQAGPMNRRKFRVVLIKPSHYDDEGYVIQWHRSSMPSNSLASDAPG